MKVVLQYMKKFTAALLIFVSTFGFLITAAEAATRVKGYTTKRGTYVQSYYRSNSNSSKWDNYSTKGNYNPYTGKKGYKRY